MFEGQKIWEEFIQSTRNIDFSSFEPKNRLHPSIWGDDFLLRSDISTKLVEIAQEFFDNLELEGVEIDDITLTGSIANYNWSKMSDVDLHIIVDFKKINKDEDLVKEYFSGKIFVWNHKHDISIYDHEVEIYVQNVDEPHVSTGVFSIKNGKWLIKPVKKEFEVEHGVVRKKSERLMDNIERVYELFDEKKYKKAFNYGKKIKEKIKNMRKAGLEGEGIYSAENLSFKVLRRNGYIGYLSDLIDQSYDKTKSLAHKFVQKLKIYVSQPENEEKKGFFALDEVEKYQISIKKRHKRMKKRLIGLGKQKNMPPFYKKPNYNRAKSASPGAGGA
jgi:predicted nucleotidyltransferase